MTVKQLMEILKDMPQDSHVYMDADGYPSVHGVHTADDFDGDAEDAPPTSDAVLIEFFEGE